MTPQRLNKYLATNFGVSRREADILIQRGKVRINGEVAQIGQRVNDGDKVTLDGKDVTKKELIYIALNKPVGGRLKQDRWEKDGQKFSRIKIEVEEVQLLGGNSSEIPNSSNGGTQPQFSAMPQNQVTPPQIAPATPAPDSSLFNNDDFPEDIPF